MVTELMKRLSSGTWFCISLLLLALGAFFWLWGDRVRDGQAAPGETSDIVRTNGQVVLPKLGASKYSLVTKLPDSTIQKDFSRKAAVKQSVSTAAHGIKPDPRFPYRLRNTTKSIGDLSRTDTAILLNNATIDSASGAPLVVPEHLRAAEDTESYLLQSVGPFEQVFDGESLELLGITKVAYIPHNTWIVRMSPEMAQRVERFPGTQRVMPFEPYYKLGSSLLEFAALQADIPGIVTLQLTVFRGQEEVTFQALEAMGTEYIGEGVSPFGPTVTIKTSRGMLSQIASLDGVLTVEPSARRIVANDLTRLRLGIDAATTNTSNTNLHDLQGKDILVNINDTGVDATHPDLQGRIFSSDNDNLRDPEGHGTHVAGTIASSGANSPTITNVFGSATNANFHGMAPESELFVLPIDLLTGPLVSDQFLQEEAATYNYIVEGRTNALISNNSWGFRNLREYNSSAASYDAAVRDALPELEGEQPILYVFAAGNDGAGNNVGLSGDAATINSPATAKNVITVGSLESLRFITNEVVTGFIDEVMTNDMGIAVTNEIPILERVFQPPTDSSTQVSASSARGNVGIGIEGDFGRFKPDVVAPGSFTISTSPTNWMTPDQFLDVTPNVISNQTVLPEGLDPYVIFSPLGAEEIKITVVPNAASPDPMPRIPIYARFGTAASTNDLVGFTSVTINAEEDSPLAIEELSQLNYSFGNPTEDPVSFDVETSVSVATESDDYFEELAKLNDSLGPYYRFESGTSMAAPAVTGMLALFQEFLRDNDHNASPALLKALLINGSRTASELYDFQIDPAINFQGWGTVNLANSLPSGMFEAPENPEDGVGATLQFFDQSPENALATGDHRSWNLTLNTNEARALPLRLTLVWTDPPGNPSAGIKLVNDLDLVVSNTLSGELYYGNDFNQNELFTSVTASNTVARVDNVNNVENIFLTPPLSTNYVVSVVARRVNVNAVTDHPDGVVQDFALVVSSGDNPNVEAPFKLEPVEEIETEYVEIPALVSITNSIPRLSDRVGANAPLLGTTNGLLPQWQFYVFTNSLPSTNDVGFTNGPNVAFVTFLPPNLARPRNAEADIDMYVSRDSGLLDLNQNVLRDAFKSTTPGGSEVVIFENQPLGDDVIYYVGVKSEDHQAGQYAFVGISQEDPFGEEDQNGNRVLRGVPLNQGIIPDGTPNEPGAALTLALGNPLNGLSIQKAISELSVVHEDIGDLLGNVSHNGVSVVLNNHTLLNPNGTFGDLNVTYDDFGAITPSSPVDGPGSLINYIGEDGTGVWLMSMVDNAFNHTGRVFGFNMILTPNRLLEGVGITGIVQPESFEYYPIEVPTDASALEVLLSDFELPLDLYLRREELPTLSRYDKRALGTNDAAGLTLRLTRTDIPPLNPGQYFVGVYNPNPVAVEFHLIYNIERDLIIDAEQPYFAEEQEVPITDDAITKSTIFVADTRGVADVKVGLRIDHSRASDLTMHLVSPLGTRVLLSENRGGTEANGWGAGPAGLATYAGFSDDPEDAEFPIKFAPLPYSTNAVIEVFKYSGFEEEPAGADFQAGETFLANAESNLWEVITGRAIIAGGNQARAPEGQNFLNLGSARVATELPTEPGRKVDLFYSTRSSAGRGAPIGRIFLDGRQAQVVDGSFDWRRNTPVRFTPGRESTLLELGLIRGRPPMQIDDIEIRDAAAVKYFFPEEELALFDGEAAVGEWTLEIWDNRAGAVEPQPLLQNWQLLMSLAETNFPAVALSNGECVTNTVIGEEIQYYIVDVPRIATIATNWLSGTGDLVLLWNEDGIPTGESPPDIFPPIDFNGEDEGEGMVLSTSGLALFDSFTNQIARFPTPVLRPGQRYYLGVMNADRDAENTYEICVQFDQDDVNIVTLTNLIAYTNVVPFGDEIELQYYRYRAGSNVLSMDIEIFPEDGDVNAVEKFGLPLPNLARFENRAEEPGLDPELITITNRAPATIIPGDYYIGVYNVEPNQTDVRYSILVTETTAPYNVIRLPHEEPIDYLVEQNVATEENESALVENYFLISITNAAVSQARVDLANLSADARVIAARDILPSLDENEALTFATPTRPGSGRVVLRTNEVRTNLVGDWFFAVLNDQPEDLAFTITGGTYTNDVPITDLVNRAWYTNTVVSSLEDAPREVDYYRFEVAENALDVSFTVEPIVGGLESDVDLLVRKEFVPTEADFDLESSTTGPETEFVGLGPDFSAALEPGVWLLAVYNNELDPVTYRIRVDQNVDLSAPDLIDDLWVTNTVAATSVGELPILDYYSYLIRQGATSATFELESLAEGGPGNVDLVVRQGELPDLVTFDFASVNGGTTPEVITLSELSAPSIAPGRWFAGVINREAVPVTYRIRATQIVPVTPPPTGPEMRVLDPDVTLIGDQICLTWDSVPGEEYFVQGRVRIDDPIWDSIRGPIVATDLSTTECLPNSFPHQFFRIIYFIGDEAPQEGDFVDTNLQLSPTEICVTWDAVVGTTYTVQAKRAIDDGGWDTLSVVEADLAAMDHCVALPTDYRIFRVGVGELGTPPPTDVIIDPELVVLNDQLCLRWPAVAGEVYTIEGKVQLTDGSWSEIDIVRSTTAEGEYCVALTTPFRFFQIRQGGELPSEPEFVEPVVRIEANQLCVSWVSMIGVEYVLEAKETLEGESWSVVSSVVADRVSTEHCLDLPTNFRYFRVRSLGAPVNPPDPGTPTVYIEPGIQISETDLCLDWVAVAGTTYEVQGKRSVADTEWTSLGTVLADAPQGAFCLSLPTDFRFFRIAVTATDPEVPGPVPGRVLDPSIGFTDTQVCLGWGAVAGGRYAIQGREEIINDSWTTAAEVVAADATPSFCLDLTTQYRFFRIVELEMTPPPVEPPANTVGFIEPFIRVMADELCVDWASQPGVNYVLQSKDSIETEDWTTVESLEATTDLTTVCINNLADIAFFRVAVLEGTAPVVPAPNPQPMAVTIDSITSVDGIVTLRWSGDAAQAYTVEYSEDIPGNWQTLGEAVFADGEFSVVDDGTSGAGGSPNRFYRVRSE